MIGSMAISDLHVESIKQEKAASSMIDSLTGFQINVDIKGELLYMSELYSSMGAWMWTFLLMHTKSQDLHQASVSLWHWHSVEHPLNLAKTFAQSQVS